MGLKVRGNMGPGCPFQGPDISVSGRWNKRRRGELNHEPQAGHLPPAGWHHPRTLSRGSAVPAGS